MNILFWIPSLATGGAERQVAVLANGLCARGHRVGIMLAYGGGALEDMVSGPELFHLDKQGRWDLFRYSHRCIRTVKEFAPDLLYSFLGTPNVFSVLLRPFLGQVKIIWGVRASDMDMSYYDFGSRVMSKAEIWLSSQADMIVFNSNAGKSIGVKRGYSAKRLEIIPNGIDTVAFAPARHTGMRFRKDWGCRDDTVLLGLVGRLDPMKNHRLFLKAASVAVSKQPSLRFVCIGNGPLLADLVAFSKRLGLSECLVWAGQFREMSPIYNALDVCCLSSITEGFPNVLGEAMSCGVPCVATDVGDASIILGNKGITVPSGDPEALAEAMLKMVSKVRKGKVPEVRSRIEEHFSVAKMLEATEDTFRDFQ